MKQRTDFLNRTTGSLFLLFFLLLLSGCADVEPEVSECLQGHTYGFWAGLWHGIIAPVSFVGSLIFDDIAVWAVNNNGGWYAFGFVLGSGIIGGGGGSAARRRSSRS
jgi:hypothetical protein